ncbi:MAG: hypothetical protein ACK5WR_13590 [Planctomycetaceae bacterium]|jgi:hypothetical protein
MMLVIAGVVVARQEEALGAANPNEIDRIAEARNAETLEPLEPSQFASSVPAVYPIDQNAPLGVPAPCGLSHLYILDFTDC